MTAFAAALATLAGLCLVAGALMLGVGIMIPSRHSQRASADADTASSGAGEVAPGTSGSPVDVAEPPESPRLGLLSRLKSAASSVIPAGDGPATPGYNDGHPVGLYLMSRYWIATRHLEKAVWYFTRDGRLYVDLEDGFSDEKLAAHKGPHGTVSVDGETMNITWSDGKKASGAFEKADGGFNYDMGLFAPVEGFSNSKQIVGRWEGGSSMSFSGGSSMTSRSLELHEDGTFTGGAAATISAASSGSVATAGGHGKTGGKWELKGYALILNYDEGTVVRGVTFPFDDEKTPVYPDRFYFAGTMYKKL